MNSFVSDEPSGPESMGEVLSRARWETIPRPTLIVTVRYSGNDESFNHTFAEVADVETSKTVLEKISGFMYGVRHNLNAERKTG